MLLLAVKLDAPSWDCPAKFSVTRLSPLSVIRRSPFSVMRGPSSNAIPPSSDSGEDARGLKPNIYSASSASSLALISTFSVSSVSILAIASC